jgi:hypothetical protein
MAIEPAPSDEIPVPSVKTNEVGDVTAALRGGCRVKVRVRVALGVSAGGGRRLAITAAVRLIRALVAVRSACERSGRDVMLSEPFRLPLLRWRVGGGGA